MFQEVRKHIVSNTFQQFREHITAQYNSYQSMQNKIQQESELLNQHEDNAKKKKKDV